jgi:hypothetical protein
VPALWLGEGSLLVSSDPKATERKVTRQWNPKELKIVANIVIGD